MAQELKQAAAKPAVISYDQSQVHGEFKDDDLVTCTYMYGQVSPNQVVYLGHVKFVGGVSRDVPFDTVKHWVKGTRAVETEDGRILTKRSYFRVNYLHAFPNDSTPVDWAKWAPIEINPTNVAAMLQAADIDKIVAQLGPERTAALIEKLKDAARSA